MEIIIFLLFIAIILLIVPVYYILKTISLWIIFKKNGKSGWISLIPFYRCIEVLNIVNLNPMYGIIFFVPGLQLIADMFLVFIIAKKYNFSTRQTTICTIIPIFGFPYLASYKDITHQNDVCSKCGFPKKGAGIYCVNCGTKL